MLRRTIAAEFVALAVLVACAPGETPGTAVTVPPALRADPARGNHSGCNGTGSVKVTPCPIVLTKNTKRGFVVMVSGPGVVNSYLEDLNDCLKHQLCYNAEREGSSQTQWRMTSGRACGRAEVEFTGVNAANSEVGHAFLKLTNEYCPR